MRATTIHADIVIVLAQPTTPTHADTLIQTALSDIPDLFVKFVTMKINTSIDTRPIVAALTVHHLQQCW